MNKKTIILIIIALIVVCLVSIKNANVVIPKEAIRIRIIANSNTEADKDLKMSVRDEVAKKLYVLLKDAKNLQEARKIINSNLDNLNISVLNDNNQSYKINYGKNYFPKKVYKGIIYEEGNYESLVITLGKGQGDNFWCVLFPPLCLLEGNENTKDVEYQFFIKELLNKYF